MSASPESIPAYPLDDEQSSRLHDALHGLTPEQLQWVSGYAAGVAAANAGGDPVPAAAAETAAALTILYGSQTGNGEQVATALAAAARDKGFAVTLQSLATYKPAGLKRESMVTFVVSTHGEGDPPDDAELFREFLLSKKAPQLESLNFSVLALGDSSYLNFCQTGREFDARLVELGAQRLLPIVECDVDYEDAANAWVDSLLAAVPAVIGAGSTAPKLRAVELPAKHDKNRPFAAEVLTNQKITAGASTKDVRHIELSLEGSGLRYEPGDALAVLVDNPPQLVAQLIDLLGFDSAGSVDVRGTSRSVGDALSSDLEITATNLGFLKTWAGISGNERLQALLDDRDELGRLVDRWQVIDVVREFPADTDAQSFVNSLRKLTPRSYSIASSLAANPDEVHLTVAAVRYEAFGSVHWGAASTHLADRLDEGDSVRVYVERNTRFRLPADDATDIIMVGPGTGVAPFRAFVEERAERAAAGRNWLFFGDRNFSTDFLYQLEWQRHLKEGRLDRLDVAFSRDQAQKIYVQDRIRASAGELVDWLDNGAHIYVCGDAKRMAGDVDNALIDVIVSQRNVGRDKAQAELKELRRVGRYQRDVY